MANDHDVAERLRRFEAERPRLTALAFRMLGDRGEAEDVVQETWLRLAAIDPTELDNLEGWLTTVVSRRCLDRLRWRRVRSERATELDLDATADTSAHQPDPEHEVLLAEAVGAALLVVLDELGPAERLAFVLHDVFDLPFAEIGRIVDRSPDATRQLASRARRRVRAAPGAPAVDLGAHRRVVEQFLVAARTGDLTGLLAVLDPAVELRPDGVAQSLGALQPTRGAAAVAASLASGASSVRGGLVDGVPALVWAPGGRLRGVIDLTIVDGRITVLTAVAEPRHLARLEVVLGR